MTKTFLLKANPRWYVSTEDFNETSKLARKNAEMMRLKPFLSLAGSIGFG